MLHKVKSRFKQSISFALALMMTLSLCVVNASAAEAPLSEPGKYTVPVAGLKSAAPLQPVNDAFATAFGDAVEITVDESGNMTAVVELQHMVVNMMGEYHANILTVTGANYLAYGTVQSSTTFGDPTLIDSIEAPTKVEFPLPAAEADGTYKIEITVDFMNNLMGNGNPYLTKVTLTLDFANAVPDTSKLSELVASYRALSSGNYTTETWAAMEEALTEAETIIANGATMAELKAAMIKLTTANDNLQWAGGDYSKVSAAIAKIPADSSLYTKASWDALTTAQNAVQQGLTAEEQSTIDGWAADLETKIAALVYNDADYSKVDAALAAVPSDLSNYTTETAQAVETAVAAVDRSLKANEQTKVDRMAADINNAVKALAEKTTSEDNSESNDTTPLDKDNLADGIYTVSVKLWNATSDQASMAASSVNDAARIVVKNGSKTMWIYTKQMTMGSITASLQEMQVADTNGNYTAATVQSKDTSGNPTSFSFLLPHTEEYIKVKVNPQVAIMGNQAIDARLKVDYTTLTTESTNPDDSTVDLTSPAASSSTGSGTTAAGTSSVKTGDDVHMNVYVLMFLISACGVGLFAIRKRRQGM